jgi:hypothetical protein
MGRVGGAGRVGGVHLIEFERMFGMMEMFVLASVEGSESMMMGAASFLFAVHAGIATAARINSRIRERMNASTNVNLD